MLASEIVVACGMDWLTWTDFVTCTKLFGEEEDGLMFQEHAARLSWPETMRWRRRVTLIEGTQDGRHRRSTKESMHSLLQSVVRLSTCSASDQRDKICGVLGISLSPECEGFKPSDGQVDRIDYQREMTDVYVLFARSVPLQGQSNRLLPYAAPRQQPSADLPSWVPDWRQAHGWHLWVYTEEHTAQGPTQTSIRGANDPSCIIIRGQRIGVVKDCRSGQLQSDPAEDGRSGLDDEWYRKLDQLEPELDPSRKRPDGTDNTFAEALDKQKRRNDWSVKGCIMEPLVRVHIVEFLAGSNLFSHTRSVHIGVTENVYRGVFRAGTEVGDRVCILYGHNLPFVLRPVRHDNGGRAQRFRLVGEGYIRGAM